MTTADGALMARVRAPGAALFVVALFVSPALASAQWLDYRTPGIPRLASGAPDLSAPAPRTLDGKPDFSGMWFANVPAKDYCREADCIQEERMAREQINLGIKLEGGLPYTEWSKQQMVERRANGGREDPHTYCKPPNFPRAWTLPQYIKIVQTPSLMVMLHEFNAAYREVFLDGRPLPEDPNPTWNGYSVGKWDGDTFVVDSVGFDDRTWLDKFGYPHTDGMRLQERYRRTDATTLELTMVVTDAEYYTRPWESDRKVFKLNGLQIDRPWDEQIYCVPSEEQKFNRLIRDPASGK